MKVHMALVWASLAAPATGCGNVLAQVPAPLQGATAWQSLMGNTIAGTTADGAYADFFQADGTAIHSDRDGRETGRWTLKEQTVCFAYPTDPDEQIECRGVEIDGSHGAFINADGSRYPFDILPGDARQLR